MLGWRMLRVFLSSLIAFGATTALTISGETAHAETRPVPENDTSSPLAQLAEAKPPAELDPWRFKVALCGWAINISGNLTVRNQAIDTNASFLDLAQHSDSGRSRQSTACWAFATGT